MVFCQTGNRLFLGSGSPGGPETRANSRPTFWKGFPGRRGRRGRLSGAVSKTLQNIRFSGTRKMVLRRMVPKNKEPQIPLFWESKKPPASGKPIRRGGGFAPSISRRPLRPPTINQRKLLSFGPLPAQHHFTRNRRFFTWSWRSPGKNHSFLWYMCDSTTASLRTLLIRTTSLGYKSGSDGPKSGDKGAQIGVIRTYRCMRFAPKLESFYNPDLGPSDPT